jgi:hypothetical protein
MKIDFSGIYLPVISILITILGIVFEIGFWKTVIYAIFIPISIPLVIFIIALISMVYVMSKSK